mmetsp:Transcript_111953/g.313022  ORF Transcript_111953/g.313022 Transcript_111953/m.313022 type:complete len:347 (-) Transcript_111953:11-1051(-)
MSSFKTAKSFNSPTRCVKPTGSVIKISETCSKGATTRSGNGSMASKPRVTMEDRSGFACVHRRGASAIFSRGWMGSPGRSMAASRTTPFSSFMMRETSFRIGWSVGGSMPKANTYSPGTIVLFNVMIRVCGSSILQPPVFGSAIATSAPFSQVGLKPSGSDTCNQPPASTRTCVWKRQTIRVGMPGMPGYATEVSAICSISMPVASPQPNCASEKTSRPSTNHSTLRGAFRGVITTILIGGASLGKPVSTMSKRAVGLPLGIGVEGLQFVTTPPPSTRQPAEKLKSSGATTISAVGFCKPGCTMRSTSTLAIGGARCVSTLKSYSSTMGNTRVLPSLVFVGLSPYG